MKRVPQCQSVHPHSGVKCWAKEHPAYEDCWAMVPIEGTDRGTRVSWKYNAPSK